MDANAEARKHSFYMLGSFEVSPDHTKLAYAEDVTGKPLSPFSFPPLPQSPQARKKWKVLQKREVKRGFSEHHISGSMDKVP